MGPDYLRERVARARQAGRTSLHLSFEDAFEIADLLESNKRHRRAGDLQEENARLQDKLNRGDVAASLYDPFHDKLNRPR